MAITSGTAGSPAVLRHLQLEVTSACNLSCAMCLVSYRPLLTDAPPDVCRGCSLYRGTF